jgi:hypothetical protein
MLILEYNQYDKYLSDKKFMKYFNDFKKRVSELFPEYELNMELYIEWIHEYYYEKIPIDDAINEMYTSGKLFKFYLTMSDN